MLFSTLPLSPLHAGRMIWLHLLRAAQLGATRRECFVIDLAFLVYGGTVILILEVFFRGV